MLIHTDEVLGERMAGPGIRAWRMAQALAPHHDVTLVSSVSAPASFDAVPAGGAHGDPFTVTDQERSDIHDLVAAADVVVHQGGSLLLAAPELTLPDSTVVVIADLYGSWILEQQEQRRAFDTVPDDDEEAFHLRLLTDHLLRADHILCASERQRELWIGHLVALGRVSHRLYRADPDFTDTITVVPFGLDATIDPASPRRVKGVVPGIAADDRVALWGGGIHDWFDPLTLVRAMAELSVTRPNARLLFLGTKHPNPSTPPMRMVEQTRELARELGVLGTAVVFNEGWVPVDERAGYFLDSDAGVSIHRPSLETEFSFRTRMLDFLWAGLPIVASTGDVFGDTIQARGLGRVVGNGDVSGLAAALDTLLFDDEARAAARAKVVEAAAEFTWPVVLAPFVELVGRARPAPGRADEAARRLAVSTKQADDAENAPKAATLAVERDAALHEVNALRRELDELRASTSWRVTAPLRALSPGARRR